jgi:hypothetical protein
MSNFVERRTYVDGDRLLIADIRDNGCVTFTAQLNGDVIMPPGAISRAATVSATVLRQIADLADGAKVLG